MADCFTDRESWEVAASGLRVSHRSRLTVWPDILPALLACLEQQHQHTVLNVLPDVIPWWSEYLALAVLAKLSKNLALIKRRHTATALYCCQRVTRNQPSCRWHLAMFVYWKVCYLKFWTRMLWKCTKINHIWRKTNQCMGIDYFCCCCCFSNKYKKYDSCLQQFTATTAFFFLVF